MDATQAVVSDFEQQYADGLITKGEKYNKVVDAWSKCTDKVADAMMAETAKPRKIINSVFMMADSGARGSKKPNETACRYARTNGETFWRNYRNTDYFKL